ncbi:hypothetical protein VTJ04DRAFT_6671 [Mycothermus thermophilus]|uniref:uncharacterized protein n=1 Tax=Humicola insolens TaxID=85995 RepID=UPI003743F79C
MPALSSAAPPGPGPTSHDAVSMTAADMDPFGNSMQFDDSMFDPVNIPSLSFPNSGYDFDYTTTFVDPFSFPPRPFDTTATTTGSDANPVLDPDSALTTDLPSPHDLDNKLLGFGAVIPSGKVTLLTDSGQVADPHITGELYGMFFVAEDVFGADSGASAGRPTELTCYRRNLWQISGQITLPRHVAQVVDEHGRRAPIADLAASITAKESIEGRMAEMITIPWRGASSATGSNTQPAAQAAGFGTAPEEPTRVPTTSPPILPLDLAGSGHEVDGGSRVSVPVSWKRLQFKHATANNGRRKGLQQHYVVQINLLVRAQGQKEYVKVAEVQSGPVIVRGRSPKSFVEARREVPLGGGRGVVDRRGANINNSNNTSTAAGNVVEGKVVKDEPGPGEMMGKLQQHQRVGSFGSQQQQQQQNTPTAAPSNPSTSDWATPYPSATATNNNSQAHPNKKLALTSPVPGGATRPLPMPAASWGSGSGSGAVDGQTQMNINVNTTPTNVASSSTNRTTGPQALKPRSLPITLTLSDDEEDNDDDDDNGQGSPTGNSNNRANSRDSGGGGWSSSSASGGRLAGLGITTGVGGNGFSGGGGANKPRPTAPRSFGNNNSGGYFDTGRTDSFNQTTQTPTPTPSSALGLGLGLSSSNPELDQQHYQLSSSTPMTTTTPGMPGMMVGSSSQNPLLVSPTAATTTGETEEDLLYEYFPLSLDDWMPPVDAIYRPHVVHHTIVPPEVKAQQVRSKAKRYFAAD